MFDRDISRRTEHIYLNLCLIERKGVELNTDTYTNVRLTEILVVGQNTDTNVPILMSDRDISRRTETQILILIFDR